MVGWARWVLRERLAGGSGLTELEGRCEGVGRFFLLEAPLRLSLVVLEDELLDRESLLEFECEPGGRLVLNWFLDAPPAMLQ